MNIELYGLNKHFLFQSQKHDDDQKTKTKTKIKEQNFNSTNEANICHKIKQIPYYKNYFMVVEDYDIINIKDESFEKIEKSKQLETDVENIKKDIDMIKDLLIQLVSNKT